jgi:hypothetical protein
MAAMDAPEAIGWARLVVQNGALTTRQSDFLRSGRQPLYGLVSSAGV